MQAVLGGLLIGLSLGLLGSGGSILTVPLLAYGMGHAERVAIAESLVIVGAIALVGSLPFVRARRVCWRSVLLFGIPGMAGTYLGAAAAPLVSGSMQLLVFGGVMLAAAGFMFRRPAVAGPTPHAPHSKLLFAFEGVVVGAVTGFVGVGGGFLIVPALVLLRGLPMHHAVGTSLLIIALKSSVGFVKYLDVLRVEQLEVSWTTIGVFIVLGAVGTQVGTRVNRRLDPRTLRRVFAAFLVVMALFVIVREGRSLRGGTASLAAEPATVPERD